jgi:hypothetical protein
MEKSSDLINKRAAREGRRGGTNLPNLNATLTLEQKRSRLMPENLRVRTARRSLSHRHLLQLVFDKLSLEASRLERMFMLRRVN